MKVELRYFTGTGNSLKVLKTCKEELKKSGYQINISAISNEEIEITNSEILGFCFPVYAFGIPRIAKKYLKALKKFDKQQKVFILITAGDIDESGFAVKECEKILTRKNCNVIYSDIIKMPVNWTTSPKPPFPPSKEEAIEIIDKGEIKTKEVTEDIINGINKKHQFNYPKRYSKLKFYWDYYLFKYLGIQNIWRLFKVYENCNGCQLCEKICPTKSINIIDKKPVWSKSCEQCMRCVNFCPKESIYQTSGGDTKDKNKYYEPGFNPKDKSYVNA